jgi:hypothetical protein
MLKCTILSNPFLWLLSSPRLASLRYRAQGIQGKITIELCCILAYLDVNGRVLCQREEREGRIEILNELFTFSHTSQTHN